MKVRINKGFTLIELLIVVAIIAILAAIAVPNFLEAQTRSKVSRVAADMRSTGTALESYAVDNNHYPVPEFAVESWSTPKVLTTPIAYITSLPHDIFKPDRDPTFPYFSYEEKDWCNKVLGRPEYWDLFIFRRGFQWLLSSFGPDLDHDWGFDPLYDPTNGTVSNGDIITVGPGNKNNFTGGTGGSNR